MGLIATDELNVMPSDTEKKPTRKKPPQPQVPYKKLKQTQKARISKWMFEAVCKYYKEHQQMPRKNCWSLCAGSFIPNCIAPLQRLPLKIYWRCFGKNRLTLWSESKRTACRASQAQSKKDGSRKTCHKACKEAGKEEKAESAARAPERSS